MITNSNWRVMPKMARVSDLLPILGNKYKPLANELAYDVLEGPAYKYSTGVEFAETFLMTQGKPVSAYDVEFALNGEGYAPKVVRSVMERLKSIANIGYVNRKFIWYEPKEGDELSQRALDEGI